MHIFATFKPKISFLFCCYQLLSQQNSNKTNKTVNKFVKKSSLTKILIDWREVLTKPITKIVVIYGSVKIKMHENKVAPTERILIHHFSTAYIQCLTIAIGF